MEALEHTTEFSVASDIETVKASNVDPERRRRVTVRSNKLTVRVSSVDPFLYDLSHWLKAF